jgi:phosphatidylglycerol:prolipoprotein diacylglycerol transferase
LTFPYHITIGHSSILLHSILELLAYILGFRYFLFLKKRKGDTISTDNRTWIFIGAIFGSLLGSRLLGGFENYPELMKSDNWLMEFYYNKTILGGLLGGLWGVEITKKIIGEKKSSGDLFVYPLLLAMIIGRIGCFSMGVYEETYGIPTTLPWGMHLGDNYLRHPVALYEIIFLAVLWVCLALIEKKRKLESGMLFKIFMISYLVFRFLLDFIKPHFTWSFGLSSIQTACLIGLLYYLYILLILKIFFPQKNN